MRFDYSDITREQRAAHVVATFKNEPRKFTDEHGHRWTAYPVQAVYEKNRDAGVALAKEIGLVSFLPVPEQIWLGLVDAVAAYWQRVRAGMGLKK